MTRLLLLLVSALALIPLSAALQAPKEVSKQELPQGRTVILVRHAEKDPAGGEDPGLSERGKARAEELARLLIHSKATQLFASNYKRTQATLAPLAKQLAVEPRLIPAQDNDKIIEACWQSPPGSTTVICGHSNTIPKLALALGVQPERLDEKQRFPENEYTRVLIVHLPADPKQSSPSLTELALSP
jgi:phosphohistidine phosphatase SixA